MWLLRQGSFSCFTHTEGAQHNLVVDFEKTHGTRVSQTGFFGCADLLVSWDVAHTAIFRGSREVETCCFECSTKMAFRMFHDLQTSTLIGSSFFRQFNLFQVSVARFEEPTEQIEAPTATVEAPTADDGPRPMIAAPSRIGYWNRSTVSGRTSASDSSIDEVRPPPGPTSRNRLAPTEFAKPTLSANRTAVRMCCAQ